MKLTAQMNEIITSDRIKHICVPHSVFVRMMGLLFALMLFVLLLWHGIWIIFSVPLAFVCAVWMRRCYAVWLRYYAGLSFVLAASVLAAAAFGGVRLIGWLLP